MSPLILPALPAHETIVAKTRGHRAIPRERPDEIDLPGPGEEGVWDFARPPLVRPAAGRLRVEWRGHLVAASDRALEIVETAGAPVPYFPPEDVDLALLANPGHITLCEWKGAAVHFDLADGAAVSRRAAFTYPDPLRDLGRGFERITGWFAFYPARVGVCWRDDEPCRPQLGGCSAGWVSNHLFGPIKGTSSSARW